MAICKDRLPLLMFHHRLQAPRFRNRLSLKALAFSVNSRAHHQAKEAFLDSSPVTSSLCLELLKALLKANRLEGYSARGLARIHLLPCSQRPRTVYSQTRLQQRLSLTMDSSNADESSLQSKTTELRTFFHSKYIFI